MRGAGAFFNILSKRIGEGHSTVGYRAGQGARRRADSVALRLQGLQPELVVRPVRRPRRRLHAAPESTGLRTSPIFFWNAPDRDVAAAAPSRLATTEEPRRGRGAAATRFHGVPAQVFDTSVDWHKSLDAFKKFDLDRRKIDPRDPRQEGGARSTKNPPPQ